MAVAGCSSKSSPSFTTASPPSGPDPWLTLPSILDKIVPPTFPGIDFEVTHYGAKSDGKTDCFPAFRNAIQACNKAGGGRVVVPAGNYICNGPIHLLSHVNLSLADNSKIVFGVNPLNYLPLVKVRWQGVQCYNYSPLIYAYQQKDIAITGGGVLEGQAKAFWWTWLDLQTNDFNNLQTMDQNKTPLNQRVFGDGHYLRPTFFEPFDCANILIEGVTFQDSPFWTMHPVFCSNVTVREVTVLPGTTNDDGCDPDSCNGVLIDSCTFTTSDDNIAIKSGRGQDGWSGPPSENIVVRNCTGLKSNSNGFCIGSEVSGGAKNVYVENCTAQNCESAYYIKSNSDRGGVIQDIYMRSNQASNCHRLIALDTEYAEITGHPYPPLFKDFEFENMKTDEATVTGIYFAGDARKPISDVALKNITVESTPVPLQISNATNISVQDVDINGQPVTL